MEIKKTLHHLCILLVYVYAVMSGRYSVSKMLAVSLGPDSPIIYILLLLNFFICNVWQKMLALISISLHLSDCHQLGSDG